MTEASGIPVYSQNIISPKNSRYCLCVFVINEGERIRAQLQRSQEISKEIDIVIVDGGSTDGSLEPGFLQSCGVRGLLIRQEPGRLGTQIRMGLHFAMQEGYDGVVVMDGNNKDNPEEVLRFIEKLQAGFDHVQGSRFIKGGVAVNTPKSRYWAIKLIHAPLISLAARFRYTDTTNGFRAYSKALITSDAMGVFRSVFQGYELHYYLAIRSARLGMSVTEVPVTRVYPSSGKVPTKITPFKGNMTVILKLLQVVFGQFNVKDAQR